MQAVIEPRRAGEITTFETRAEANEKVDRQLRYSQIREILKDNELTAKEIAVEMYKRGFTPTSERNFASPRLTELLQKGQVEVIGKRVCEYTGATVSVFKLRKEN